MRQKQKLHLMVITALFAASITVMTAYMLHIPIPTGGYIHLGDALIYLAACLLPTPCAAAAAAIGAGLADLLTAPVWVLPTLIIKAVVVLFFTSGGERLLCRRNLAAMVAAGLFSPSAYALAGCAMAGTMAAFVPQFLGTLVQGIGSGALFLVIAPALDGVKLKERVRA
ncbi:TIGR04002 family protein [Colidextribacter sp. OB.20]|uniref:TIGR04002 family protein n=1 Tax=Colidextribacter sp. OB.20 TaxID=2304568 RepID=UPI0013693512|nr:TIGR04002 family protein [Colidextribacter sp. OB.20]NBI08865.1 TIGR04002 family protein [Colidextribacter sp. OB.20]